MLGPLLFLIFTNQFNFHDLPDGITSICKIFADDSSLFSKVYDIDISPKELNSDLAKISKWAFQWKTQFNPDSNKQANEVIFSRKKNPALMHLLLSITMTLRNILITSIWVLFYIQN